MNLGSPNNTLSNLPAPSNPPRPERELLVPNREPLMEGGRAGVLVNY
jgi:hypothetical protein